MDSQGAECRLQRQGYTENDRLPKATTLPVAFLACSGVNRWGAWMSGEQKRYSEYSCLTWIAVPTADTVSNAVIIAGFED